MDVLITRHIYPDGQIAVRCSPNAAVTGKGNILPVDGSKPARAIIAGAAGVVSAEYSPRHGDWLAETNMVHFYEMDNWLIGASGV